MELVVEFLNTLDERTFSRHGENHVPADRLEGPETAKALRTALREALSGDAPDLSAYPLRLEVGATGELRLTAHTGTPQLDAVLEAVATSVAQGDWKRLKLCAAPDCRWAFHDTSRSGRGRWCDMEVCGNRHKTRTYRERRQQAK
ncbi:CGNR zinc finger domain-containing protein [Cryptosporangium sp. NPDC048952]|uniref:CGNR zinc finger domain-containing protein n=1 Tax=Cryptosporangium sp. NPDC048952 TaxID=3363961 RepID=UPI00371B7E77